MKWQGTVPSCPPPLRECERACSSLSRNAWRLSFKVGAGRPNGLGARFHFGTTAAEGARRVATALFPHFHASTRPIPQPIDPSKELIASAMKGVDKLR